MIIALTLTMMTNVVFAGHNNQNTVDNGKSVERGTGKYNELDGCNPDINAPNVWIDIGFVPPPITTSIWQGAPCCAHRAGGSIDVFEGEPVWMPNQCCNPPYYTGEFVPGNHCRCFENRGWPDPNALPLL